MNDKMIYEAINQPVFQQVPQNAKRVLDIGCGTASLGKTIKQIIKCEVVGVTYSQTEANLASQVIDQVLVADINDFDPASLGKFDCIICSHILEHLYNPQVLLRKLHDNLTNDGILVIALPNILYFKQQRWEFIKGNFKYTDGGLMDKTHFRFFDWEEALDLVKSSGFQIIYNYADGNFPLPIIRKVKLFTPLCSYLDKLASRIFPGLFGIQFIIIAKSL